MEMWKDGVLTQAALDFLVKDNQERIKRAQEWLGPPWQSVVIGPKGAVLVDPFKKT